MTGLGLLVFDEGGLGVEVLLEGEGEVEEGLLDVATDELVAVTPIVVRAEGWPAGRSVVDVFGAERPLLTLEHYHIGL